MGNQSKKTLKALLGQHTATLNNSPSYSIQDGFHLFELHGETSIQFILIILVMALIGLSVKLRVRKQKLASIGLHSGRPTNGEPHLSPTLMGQNGRSTIYIPPQINPQYQWVDLLALNLRLMKRLFEMLFWNAMQKQQNTARVTPMPMVQIIEMPIE